MRTELYTPLKEIEVCSLKAGDSVFITGTIYTARDAAHKRMLEELSEGKKLPFNIEGSIIYYLGPTPAKPNQIIGSAGPTTSTRMDKYTPMLLELGLKGMIGKGKRGREVVNAMIETKSIYFAATGGAGALLSKCIKHSEVIAYDNLGTEAIRKLEVVSFPVIVAIDCGGNCFYKE